LLLEISERVVRVSDSDRGNPIAEAVGLDDEQYVLVI
jgi:hypothetical protein